MQRGKGRAARRRADNSGRRVKAQATDYQDGDQSQDPGQDGQDQDPGQGGQDGLDRLDRQDDGQDRPPVDLGGFGVEDRPDLAGSLGSGLLGFHPGMFDSKAEPETSETSEANLNSKFQAYPRIRVVDVMNPYLHQTHVIRAITRHPEIDKEDLYGQALRGLRHGNNARAFSALGEFARKATSGTLLDDKSDAPVQPLLNIDLRNVDEHTCSKIREINRRYLNDKGISALLTLLTFDATDLDPAAIDTFRGGEPLEATYGLRKTQQAKELGAQIQLRIKGLESSDEAATMGAADRYVEYRYLHDGSFPDYKKRKELEGDTGIHRYYRGWFRKFDKALGFPRPGRGRPSNTLGQR